MHNHYLRTQAHRQIQVRVSHLIGRCSDDTVGDVSLYQHTSTNARPGLAGDSRFCSSCTHDASRPKRGTERSRMTNCPHPQSGISTVCDRVPPAASAPVGQAPTFLTYHVQWYPAATTSPRCLHALTRRAAQHHCAVVPSTMALSRTPLGLGQELAQYQYRAARTFHSCRLQMSS